MLGPEPTIHAPVNMAHCTLGKWTEIYEYSHLEYAEYGDYSYSGPYCFMQNVVIGKFSNIAAAVRIGPTMHPMDRPTLHHFTYRRKLYGFDEKDDEEFFEARKARVTFVGHDTWIGHGAIIMPGLKIGTGAVIGSGSVVTHDVGDYEVAVGVPARVIKRRFDEKLSERLLEMAWWDWPHEVLKERLADFCGSAEAFVEKYGRQAAR